MLPPPVPQTTLQASASPDFALAVRLQEEEWGATSPPFPPHLQSATQMPGLGGAMPQAPSAPTSFNPPPGHRCRRGDIDIPWRARFQYIVCGHRFFADRHPILPPDYPSEWQTMIQREMVQQRQYWENFYREQDNRRAALERKREDKDEDDGPGARRHKKG